MNLLSFRPEGIYCERADVYLDPWKPVKRAMITHGHSDHARWGHKHYLATESAAPVIRYRLGDEINLQTIQYGQKMSINGVDFSFHPAGHIIGSAQIRVAYKGEVWVYTGDFKNEDDGISEPYEQLKCNAIITECTFGLPVYKWQPQQLIFDEINNWWKSNKENGKVSVITAYALGKAQRLIKYLDPSIGTIFTHGAIENTNEIIRQQGFDLQETVRVVQGMKKGDFDGGIVVALPSAIGSPWIKKFRPISVGIASGWMTLRGARRRRAADRGFVLSDHADWPGLNQAIIDSGAERVYATHGYTGIFAQWIEEQGLWAAEVETKFEGELAEMGESTDSANDTKKEAL